jgi:hypothetical protein
MRSRFSLTLLLFLLLAFGPGSQAKTTNPETLARAAVSDSPGEAASAIAELRASGPAGLDVLLHVYADEINRQVANPTNTPEWQRLSDVIDAVSQQKNSYLSGLYWYTDLNQAKTASLKTGRPILSLRLLGKLNEEFSCANSRFFRTVLYSNAEISQFLRDRFILHWQSVRPAPRLTIDFGDGRKLEGTITGNSIHYVIGADGRPVDALPGLYGPNAFLRWLGRVVDVNERVRTMDPAARAVALADYHRSTVRALTEEWIADAQRAGGKIPEYLIPKSRGTQRAADIAPLAVTKMITEIALLKAITRDAEALGAITDEPTWTRIAFAHIFDAKLDDRSLSLVRRQTANLPSDQRGLSPEIRLMNLVQKLQLNIALDTVRNEYMLHTKLHAWLAIDPSRFDLDALNEKVYASLFLTPKSDPWLGLFSPEVYTALDRGGIAP